MPWPSYASGSAPDRPKRSLAARPETGRRQLRLWRAHYRRAVIIAVDGSTFHDELYSALKHGDVVQGVTVDYEQVRIIPLIPNEKRWFLGYPTITRDLSLPRGGIRGKGLEPDVRVKWESVADPIGYVIRALGR